MRSKRLERIFFVPNFAVSKDKKSSGTAFIEMLKQRSLGVGLRMKYKEVIQSVVLIMVGFKFDFSGEASPRNRLVRENRTDFSRELVHIINNKIRKDYGKR